MKKLLAILFAAAVLVTVFAGCNGSQSGSNSSTGSSADAESKTQETLVVSTNAEFEPFESVDSNNNLVGFDIDLMNAVGEKMGVKVKFDNGEFDGVIAAVTQKTADAAISGLTINEKRSKSVDFSTPYYEGAAQILIVAKNDSYYTGTTKEAIDEQLKNQRIGVCTGFTGQSYALGDDEWGFKKIEGADVKIYENISLATKDLENGAINAIIMDDKPAKEAVAQNSEKIKTIDVPLTIEKYGIAVAKGNTELKGKIDKALEDLKSEGKIDELLKKYELN